MGVWYDPQRNGSITDYVENCWNERVPPCFKGPEQFQQLVDLGYITPDVTSLRIMYSERCDEFYQVVDGFRLEGVELNAHSGQPGIHDPCMLLSGDVPHYEVSSMNPHPVPRKR